MSVHKKPELLSSWRQEKGILSAAIKEISDKKTPLQILEAGCGHKWLVDLSDVPFSLTGVDQNQEALNIRSQKQKDLHKAVLGDLRYVEFSNQSFDVIYCSFVLEHIDGAEKVMNNFVSWLRPGGLIVLRIPDRNSVYGLISKTTPFWVHVFFKKYFAGNKQAGQPGHPPYPVYFD